MISAAAEQYFMASDQSTGAKRALEGGEPSKSEASLPNLPAVPDKDGENLQATAADAGLSQDVALSLLSRPDLSAEVLEQLGKNSSVLKHRRVKLALVEHPKTPRHVSLPMVRQLYTFDLMQVALTPVVPADIKVAADEALSNRMGTISSGEKLSLAHRASGRVAGELLLDAEARIVHAALQNPRITESSIVRALLRHEASGAFVEAVCHHPQWSLRREVRVALLRNEKTPMARAVEFARAMPAEQVREILHSSRLPEQIKAYLRRDLENRGGRARSRG
jgi:hypothetical protein